MHLYILSAIAATTLCLTISTPLHPSILQLPSNDTDSHLISPDPTSAQSGKWPNLPLTRPIDSNLSLTIQQYGRSKTTAEKPAILKAIATIESTFSSSDHPDDYLPARFSGNSGPVSIQFSSADPLVRLTSSQVSRILETVWEIIYAYKPPREIRLASIELQGKQVAMFAMEWVDT